MILDGDRVRLLSGSWYSRAMGFDSPSFRHMDNFAYHATPARNLSSIQEHGLLPSIGSRSRMLGEELGAVYLFPSLEDLDNALSNWLGELFDEEGSLALLQVDVAGIDVEWGEVEYEILSFSTIPPANITVLQII